MAEVLVTGATSGFGLLTSLELARQGHRVFATARSPEGAAQIREESGRSGVTLEVVAMDVADDESVREGVAEVEERAGALDVVINNAGALETGPFETMSDSAIRLMFETNLYGFLRVTRAVLPGMRERRRGAIVSITSMLGHVPGPFNAVYSASKSAVTALTEALAIELAPFGIRMVTVIPGAYSTKMMTRPFAVRTVSGPYDELHDRYRARLKGRIAPPGREGEVVDAIIAAAFDEPARVHVPAGSFPTTELADRLGASEDRIRRLRDELGVAAPATA